jgi:hypothetical protein
MGENCLGLYSNDGGYAATQFVSCFARVCVCWPGHECWGVRVSVSLYLPSSLWPRCSFLCCVQTSFILGRMRWQVVEAMQRTFPNLDPWKRALRICASASFQPLGVLSPMVPKQCTRPVNSCLIVFLDMPGILECV